MFLVLFTNEAPLILAIFLGKEFECVLVKVYQAIHHHNVV